jgi:hypothetical protein
MIAWFSMSPDTEAFTVTRNATVVLAPMLSAPPDAPFAPVPSRTRTVRLALRYSPWSSPVASVFVPVFGPAVTRIEPGTKVTPAGSTSLRIVFVAPSLPWFVAEIVYSSVSPGSTDPPACAFRSVTVFVAPPKSGLYVEIDVTKAPSR